MQLDIDRLLLSFPNLKARDIAKRIGHERADISKFLHANPERYEQNAEYEWKLKVSSRRSVSLHTGWMTADAFETVFRVSGDLFDAQISEVEFIFPASCKPMMDALARLLALINQLALAGKQITVDVTQATTAKAYLNRAGFFDLLDPQVNVLPNKPSNSTAIRYKGNSENLIEFGPVDPSKENRSLVVTLTEAFVALSSLTYQTAALTVFGELIGNVSEHSQSPVFGFAGLQHYGKGRKPHIQTVVSDSGLGIAGTLRPVLLELHPQLFQQFKGSTVADDAGLVEHVLRSGEISRVNKEGRGLGLKSSQDQAAKFNATLTVRQERFSLCLQYANGELAHVERTLNLQRLAGTHICFDFYL